MGDEPELRVLLVDDEPDIREIARMALETVGGMIVHTCSGGREALDSVGSFGPDIVLLDVMMPDMDGPGVLRELRKRPNFSEIPAIFVTAKAHPDEVRRLKGQGANDVLGKPFDPMSLSEQVRNCYQSARREPGNDQGLREKTAQLRHRLLDRLAKERPDLERLGRSLRGVDGMQPADAADLLQRAHRIAGTAGTVGLDGVSAAAARLETAVEARDEAMTKTALADLVAEIDQAAADEG